MAYIRETILTTISDAGEVHIAPLGIIKEGDGWVIAPFRPSTTLTNIEANGLAVVNYTDEAKIFAGCLTGRKDWPLTPLDDCKVPRLEAALSHEVLKVERVTEDATRPRFFCKVVSSGQHRPFLGMNRAKAAVLEAAILVSRLKMLPAEKIETEIAYLKIAIDKTAGPDEETAFYWLLEEVIEHLAEVEGAA
ncbi:MAG: tetrahydromethanopterin synthesis protein [Fulvimarina sp.]|nr:tetrahydromethanopterin synthesis protein [Fulvimarina sp.]